MLMPTCRSSRLFSCCCECCQSSLVCVKHKAVLSRFSAERKEAESASLSAKEECFGRLIEGERSGGGVVVDTFDNPPTHPTPSSTTASSSSPPASVRCLRQRASGSDWLHLLLIQDQWNHTCRGWSLALGFLFDASCLNFFYCSVQKEGGKKTSEKFSTEKCVL